MLSTLRNLFIDGDAHMPWRNVAVTISAIALPAVVAVLLFGPSGAVAFVAAMPAHLAAKDNGIKVGALVTLVMGMAGLLSLGNPAMALIVAPTLGLMSGICGSFGLARPCIRALLTWTIFTSPIIEGPDPTFLFAVFVAAMIWSLWLTWVTGDAGTNGDEERESEEYVLAFGVVLAVGLFVSVYVGHRFFGDHGFWFPLTFVVLVLPPHGQLFRRTWMRSVGTVLGTAATLGAAALTSEPWVMVLTGAIAMPLGFRFLPSSYTTFTFFLTIAVLEVLALVSDVDHLALERVGTMAAAAAMTLLLGFLGWAGLKLFRPNALDALQEDAS